MSTRTRPAVADQAAARPSFVVSSCAVACAVVIVTLVFGAVMVGLVALAEPTATVAALRDGFAYLWTLLVGAASSAVGGF